MTNPSNYVAPADLKTATGTVVTTLPSDAYIESVVGPQLATTEETGQFLAIASDTEPAGDAVGTLCDFQKEFPYMGSKKVWYRAQDGAINITVTPLS